MSFELIKKCIYKNDIELFAADVLKNVRFNLNKNLLQ